MDEMRYAILIGINDYKKPLRFSVKDVNRIYATLIDNCRFEKDNIKPIFSEKDYHNSKIIKDIDTAINEIAGKIKPEDTVLFYYSGHGHAGLSGLQLEIHDQDLSFSTIYEKIDRLNPRHQIYILDTCHSGAAEIKENGIDAMTIYYNEKFAHKSTGIQMLCSCRDDQRSHALAELDNSVYTYYLLQAIANRDFYDSDLKTLSLGSVHEYAAKRIELSDEVQVPFYATQITGYYPFAFLSEKQVISNCSLVVHINNENEVYDFMDKEQLNLPESFKKDFAVFLAELSLNLFNHNFSEGISLHFHGNTIEIHDKSRQSFNPFTAVPTTDGKGIIVYQLFLKKYVKQMKVSYEPGYPNIIRFAFDDSIFLGSKVNPCYLEVSDRFLLSLSALNLHNFDLDCDEITIDIKKSVIPLSVCVRLFDELLRRTERRKPLIILKMEQEDMQREGIISCIRYSDYKRIIVL